MRVDGLLLDIDGVLTTSWRALPGSIGAMTWLREHDIPLRLITNTTTHTRADLAATLRDAGFTVTPEEIVTAVVATAGYLRAHHPGAPTFVLSDGDPRGDLDGVELAPVEKADVVVIGGAGPDFTYETLNAIFRRLKMGAQLVGMHRNLYWATSDGLELDGGAFIAGLEEAASIRAAICGKPAPEYFAAALDVLGISADRAAMVGDDVVNDVLGAQAVGLTGVLVRTGKFHESDLSRGHVDVVIDSLARLPAWLEGA